jgi:exopolyphosphatase
VRDRKHHHHHEHSHYHDHHQTKKEKDKKGERGRHHKIKTKKTTGKKDNDIPPTSTTPTSVQTDTDNDSPDDLWEQVRKYLDTGYVLIGNFQDLHNANIKYTHKRLVKYQLKIWQWHTNFISFVKTNEQIINFYLSFPCKSSGHHSLTMMMMKTSNSHIHNNNKRCSHIHDHSSHLFWGGTSKNDLPDGNIELAVHALGRLGYSQLGRAETYLRDALVYEYVLNSTNIRPPNMEATNNNITDDAAVNVQEIYHNFRKELRSFLDELDLFGESFIPGSSVLPEIVRWHRHTPSSVNMTIKKGENENIDQIINLLMTTRLKLGDVNDNYVKYTRYKKWDTHHVLHDRQPRHKRDISKVQITLETKWKEFRQWAVDVELLAKIEFLRYSLYPDESLGGYSEEIGQVQMEKTVGIIDRPYLGLSPSPYDSLGDFLIKRKANITDHVVIGNEAGDADTIVTSITLAFLESMQGYGGDAVTPIVAISKDVFHKERPDVNLLFQLAGLQEFTDNLLFIEDLEDVLKEDVKEGLPSRLITLVDHNNLNEPLVKYQNNLVVTEILDHHEDLHKYEDTCSGKDRNIAFDNGHALVASATTLVAERLHACDYPHPCPATIGTLLLGVILIDSINLDESLGKVTQRDRNAVKDLLANTDWSTHVHLPHIRLNANGDITVDTDKLFDELQVAKYDPLFWANFPVSRALASDYKQFGDGTESLFGIATVLMNGQEFMKKEEFASATLDFMHTSQISFLGIMFAFYDESRTLRRQLAFVTKGEKFTLEQILESLLKSVEYKKADLQLEEVTIHKKLLIEEVGLLQIRLFDQTNPAPSRKQIGPMLEVYFNGLEL